MDFAFISIFTILQQRRNNAMMAQARATMHRIGMQLIEERQRAVMDDMRSGAGKSVDGIDGDKTKGRDLLSVLSAFTLRLCSINVNSP
jgi:hypothetical protein